MKHTPGPWYSSSASSVVGALVGVSATHHVAAVMPQTDKLECEANAKLIAAAPELLAACEQVLIGGNHLASALMGLGVMPNKYVSRYVVLDAHGVHAAELWTCWRTIMDMRAVKEKAEGVE